MKKEINIPPRCLRFWVNNKNTLFHILVDKFKLNIKLAINIKCFFAGSILEIEPAYRIPGFEVSSVYFLTIS
jgi:hypothetical protein